MQGGRGGETHLERRDVWVGVHLWRAAAIDGRGDHEGGRRVEALAAQHVLVASEERVRLLREATAAVAVVEVAVVRLDHDRRVHEQLRVEQLLAERLAAQPERRDKVAARRKSDRGDGAAALAPNVLGGGLQIIHRLLKACRERARVRVGGASGGGGRVPLRGRWQLHPRRKGTHRAKGGGMGAASTHQRRGEGGISGCSCRSRAPPASPPPAAPRAQRGTRSCHRER